MLNCIESFFMLYVSLFFSILAHRIKQPIPKLWIKPSFAILLHLTAKRIQDRFIVSSIKPKFDDRFLVDLRILYKLRTWNCLVLICTTGRTISGLQLVQNPFINKKLVVKFWLHGKNYASFLYSFSCNYSLLFCFFVKNNCFFQIGGFENLLSDLVNNKMKNLATL